ncbi:acyl-CoA dehydrogenase [Nocardia acidivorans]|uniref:acyl-CoA dehydrogenase n=1 Tax=Nocardia acidivorans TaxID=404580 RepID=UPI00082D4CC3|nr:acyl-CoA dehydrogenase [Nocardia acidivorans]
MNTVAAAAPPLFEFTDEHRDLRQMLRRRFDHAAASEGRDSGAHASEADGAHTVSPTWTDLAHHAGIGDLLFGGADEPRGTPIDIAILAEESGAALYGGPVFSAAVTAALCEIAGNRERPTGPGEGESAARFADLVRGLREGRVAPAIGSCALGHGAGANDSVSVRAGQRLSGRVEPVWDARHATVLVCVAVDASGDPAVAVLPTRTAGFTMTALAGLDLSRAVGRADCVAVAAESLLTGDTARRALAAMRARGALVAAAESLGLAQRTLDRTVEYARGRVQFGRTIGSFQAVKHRLADLVSQVELTRSAVYGAAWGLTTAPEDTDTAIDLAVAAALAADTAVTVTTAAVQLHGGIAITWEHHAHRALRRARAVAALTGGAVRHRRDLAALLDQREARHG